MEKLLGQETNIEFDDVKGLETKTVTTYHKLDSELNSLNCGFGETEIIRKQFEEGKIKSFTHTKFTGEVYAENYFYSPYEDIVTIISNDGKTTVENYDGIGRKISARIITDNNYKFIDFNYGINDTLITRTFESVETTLYAQPYALHLISEVVEDKNGNLLYRHTDEGGETRLVELDGKYFKKYIETFPINKDATIDSNIYFVEFNEDGKIKRTFIDSKSSLKEYSYNFNGDLAKIIDNETGYKEQYDYQYDGKNRIINIKKYYEKL